MANGTTTPADVLREMDEVIEEAEAAEGGEAQEIDATEKAREMADDFDVDLAEVKGTGADGRVTVMDVDRFVKARDEEQQIEREDPQAEPKAEKQPKPKAKSKAKAATLSENGLGPSSVPTVYAGLVDVHHVIRSMAEFGSGEWSRNPVARLLANEKLGEMLAEGWQLLKISNLGFGPDGINMVWIFGKFAADIAPRDYPYREIDHVTRSVGPLGDDSMGLSEASASAMVRGKLADGWDLASVDVLDRAPANRLNFMWVFVR